MLTAANDFRSMIWIYLLVYGDHLEPKQLLRWAFHATAYHTLLLHASCPSTKYTADFYAVYTSNF